MRPRRYIIVGDVHGCLEELKQLLISVNLDPETDTLVMIGDLLDKGPSGPEVVAYVRKLAGMMRVVLLLGNHEDKNLRFFRHADRSKALGIKNPMAESPSVDNLWDNYRRMTPEDIEFIEKSSLFYFRIPEHDTIVVHGGIPPRLKELVPNEELAQMTRKQRGLHNQILRVRWVRDGNMLTMGEQTEDDTFWADVYDGRFGHAFFGHEAISFEEPSQFPHATGIDLACIYGGYLCAAILSDTHPGVPGFVKVPYSGPPENIWSTAKEK